MWRDALTRRFPALVSLPGGCYVVGGAIRDLILGREPVDVDVACPEPLSAAQRVQSRVIRLGDQQHLSAWRVVCAGHLYDFAAILDGDIAQDLARRDFTANAMAVDLESGLLLDPHNGRGDLERRLVRMVDATNFDDDPLRTLKGVRMAVRYGMEIEEATLEAIRQRAPRIAEIAPERVTYELSVIFSSDALRRAVDLLDRAGLAAPLGLPSRPFESDDVSVAGAFALLVSDPASYARRWRWSGQLLREVATLQRLIERHDRMSLFDAGEAIARQLPPVLRALGRDATLDWPDFSIRALLTGDEISAIAGIAPGKRIGALKRALREAHVAGSIRTREQAVELVRGERSGGD
jgi:hypothetical protein